MSLHCKIDTDVLLDTEENSRGETLPQVLTEKERKKKKVKVNVVRKEESAAKKKIQKREEWGRRNRLKRACGSQGA